MSSGEWRPFCLGLNVLTQGYDANKGDLKGENLLIITIETWNISSKNWQNYLYMKYCQYLWNDKRKWEFSWNLAGMGWIFDDFP